MGANATSDPVSGASNTAALLSQTAAANNILTQAQMFSSIIREQNSALANSQNQNKTFVDTVTRG